MIENNERTTAAQSETIPNSRSNRRYWFLMAAISTLFIALTVGHTITQRPWSDEGWFANPAYNLAANGFMGTTVFEPSEQLKGIQTRTYWVMPLYLALESAWLKMVGFSLFKYRLLSLFFGLIGLAAWFSIMRSLWRNKALAGLAVCLVGLDYYYISSSSFGRMDIICATFGYAGLAAYLHLRERNWLLAISISHALICASGLSHFLGVMPLVGLVFLTFYYDRDKIGLKAIGAAVIPYVIGAVGWGWYILQAPSDFIAQFSANATDSQRMSALSHPMRAIALEIKDRYMVGFGLGSHSAGHSDVAALKALVLLALLIGLLGVALTPGLRRQKGCRVLLGFLAIYFVILTLLDGQKLTTYLIHIIPIYAACLAVWIHWLWTRRLVTRWLIAPLVAGLLLLQIGGVVWKIKLNSYGRSFAPAVAFLKQTTNPNSIVFASADMGFGLGFDKLTDDNRLGYYSHRSPDFIVVEEVYLDAFDGHRKHRPAVDQFVKARLKEYDLIYDHAYYKIYGRNRVAPQEVTSRGQ